MNRRYLIPNRLGRLMIFVMMTLVILPIALLAQAAGQALPDTATIGLPVVHQWQDALVWLIPLAVPILIGFAKKYLYEEVPQPDGSIVLDPHKWLPKWALPLIAPALGILLEYIMYLAGAGAGSALTGALLGALGTWLREVFKPLTNARLSAG